MSSLFHQTLVQGRAGERGAALIWAMMVAAVLSITTLIYSTTQVQRVEFGRGMDYRTQAAMIKESILANTDCKNTWFATANNIGYSTANWPNNPSGLCDALANANPLTNRRVLLRDASNQYLNGAANDLPLWSGNAAAGKTKRASNYAGPWYVEAECDPVGKTLVIEVAVSMAPANPNAFRADPLTKFKMAFSDVVSGNQPDSWAVNPVIGGDGPNRQKLCTQWWPAASNQGRPPGYVVYGYDYGTNQPLTKPVDQFLQEAETAFTQVPTGCGKNQIFRGFIGTGSGAFNYAPAAGCFTVKTCPEGTVFVGADYSADRQCQPLKTVTKNDATIAPTSHTCLIGQRAVGYDADGNIVCKAMPKCTAGTVQAGVDPATGDVVCRSLDDQSCNDPTKVFAGYDTVTGAIICKDLPFPVSTCNPGYYLRGFKPGPPLTPICIPFDFCLGLLSVGSTFQRGVRSPQTPPIPDGTPDCVRWDQPDQYDYALARADQKRFRQYGQRSTCDTVNGGPGGAAGNGRIPSGITFSTAGSTINCVYDTFGGGFGGVGGSPWGAAGPFNGDPPQSTPGGGNPLNGGGFSCPPGWGEGSVANFFLPTQTWGLILGEQVGTYAHYPGPGSPAATEVRYTQYPSTSYSPFGGQPMQGSVCTRKN